MRLKLLIIVALLGLIAAGCSKKTAQQNDTTVPQQTNNQNSSDLNILNQQPQGSSAGGSDLKQTAPQPDHFSDGSDMDIMPQPEVKEIVITATGFSPSTITVKAGDYVQFTNKDSVAHRPASAPHPVHTDLPGFDAGKGLAPGEKYRFQFTKTGSWSFHDHFNPAWTGTVIVQ